MLLAAALVSVLGAVELRWETAPGCPDAAAVGRDVDAILGRRPRDDGAAVSGRLEAGGGGYVLHLAIAVAGRRETRELRANDCAVLTRAGVLVVAVTVDALAATAAVDATVDATAEAEPEDAIDRGPAPVTVSPAPVRGLDAVPGPSVAAQARPSRRSIADAEAPSRVPSSDAPPGSGRRGLTLAASAGVAQGMTPGVTGGIEGRLEWRRGALRLAASGFHWFARTTELRPEVGIESALSGGSLRGCLAFDRARLEVPLCAGLELAAMHGGGVGAAVMRRDARDLWVGVAAGAGLTYWPLRRLALEARVEGVLGARRPAMFLVIDGEPRDAFRMAPVGVRLLVGPVVRLW